ncbi:hypothetical protein HZS_2640 [Henneguya salminicola]|nr:hypothetical protein HZS_2640 [Henneguya salminicola]
MHCFIKRKPERSRAQLLVQSKRGKEKLNHEGHFYMFDKLSAFRSKKFWRCELKNECKARLHTTVYNLFLMQINQHSHRRDIAQLQVATVMSGIKRRAPETTEIPSVILNGALQQTSIATQFARLFSGEEAKTKEHLHNPSTGSDKRSFFCGIRENRTNIEFFSLADNQIVSGDTTSNSFMLTKHSA